VEQSAHPRPRGTALRDRMVTCLWWLLSLGGVADGTLADVVVALRLGLTTLGRLLLSGACRPRGDIAGWPLAARPDPAVARKELDKDRQRHGWLRGVVTRCGSEQRGDARGWATVADVRAAPGGRLKQRAAACP